MIHDGMKLVLLLWLLSAPGFIAWRRIHFGGPTDD